ncbi:MAG: sulfotransferase family protein [Solirubrobacterales bacterium]
MRLPSPLAGRRRRAQGSEHPPAPFVVGVARSSTTLLRLMLDAHPELTIPPETHFIPKLAKALDEEPGGDVESRRRAHALITEHRRWPDFGLDPDELAGRFDAAEPFNASAALRAFYGLYAEAQEKPRWGDKSPSYVRRMPKVQRALPEAHFIHLIRDGRDVALSQLEVHHGNDEVSGAATEWVGQIKKARRSARRLDAYTELRYEDLVEDPEPALRQVCDECRIDFDPAMLDYHQGAEKRMAETVREFSRGEGTAISAEQRAAQHANVAKPPQRERAGRWRRDMSTEQIAAFESVAGPLLADLGYDLSGAEHAP